MIISHRLKFAFFRVPKTGSTTVELVLRMCGALDENDIYTAMPLVGFSDANLPPPLQDLNPKGLRVVEVNHGTPTDAIGWGLLTEAQLNEYRCFAFLREPLDRFVSAYAHASNPILVPAIFRELVMSRKNLGLLVRPTTEYFYYNGVQVCEPLHFSDFVNEINKMVRHIGGHEFTLMPRMNRSRAREKNTSTMAHYDAASEAVAREMNAGDLAFFAQAGPGP